ncbi:MAG TPA: hypothetical protein DDX39_04335 [Bacteroidales bacterium]|nr:MAG: hypothetical protein A2W98_10665 [Bacteroidetes bacterium GWF2_33_38]OFY85455.1 MAG: hypothetical protein A2236_11570 [Bacteroidetes bacterium RIFOXYA2_FULL_33_7]HBF87851.1 hypothetical protein [Bacteroidales bacterium]
MASDLANAQTKNVVSTVSPKEYYVSVDKGKGNLGTKKKPVKDLGDIISLLAPGDIVHIAQGEYLGTNGIGAYSTNVPCTIIGGYSNDFSQRDPWGEYKTIFSGSNRLNETSTEARLKIETHLKYPEYKGEIVVDGIIIDNGDRNLYADEKKLQILRTDNSEQSKHATPNTEGIKITTGKYCNATVKNCIVLNTASLEGAIYTAGNKSSMIKIDNNLIINNTGEGIHATSLWKPADGNNPTMYEITNNTILFTWRYDELAKNYSGNALKMDKEVQLMCLGNIFGFSDVGGINNVKAAKNIILIDNLFMANREYDYRESESKMRVGKIGLESKLVAPESSENLSEVTNLQVDSLWAEIYASRKIIAQAKTENNTTAENSDNNSVRTILNLELKNDEIIETKICLHHMDLEKTIKIGIEKYLGKFGCVKP